MKTQTVEIHLNNTMKVESTNRVQTTENEYVLAMYIMHDIIRHLTYVEFFSFKNRQVSNINK